MKKAEVESTCSCGAKVEAFIGKPTRMEAKHTKVTCSGCGSRFLISAFVDNTQKGRHVRLEVNFISMSSALKEKLADAV